MISNSRNSDREVTVDEVVAVCSWLRNRSWIHIFRNAFKVKMMSQKDFDIAIRVMSSSNGGK